MDKELNKLSRMNPPKPSDEARQQALARAMQAFEEQKKNHGATQGSRNGRRHSSISNLIWSYVMNRKLLAGSALATLIVVPAATYITIGMINDRVVDFHAPLEVAEKPKVEVQEPVGAGDERNGEPGRNATGDVAAGREKQAKDAEVKPAPKVAEETDADAGQMTAEVPQEAAPVEVMPLPEAEVTLHAAAPRTAVARKQNPGAMVRSEGVIGQPHILRQKEDRDRFTAKDANPVKSVVAEPVSTFSIDVDTASYAYMRQAILNGRLPAPESVRVEEMINYFPYDWTPPESAEQAFKASITVMPTPWNQHTQLMHIGIRGYEIQVTEQRPANLVFLIDVSGSMDEPNKLPLLKSAFRLLVNKLKPTDTVSIVVYAGASGVVLEPTKVEEKVKILDAIDKLQPGGSTAGAEGIEMAYRLAEKAFVKDGVNRILLATDGDFNVGPSTDEELKRLIEAKRKTGIFLSVLGFGTGNYNDSLMQVMAQNGNGVAAYIDGLSEAQKTLVEEATSSLFPIAKDVKIQVEFNPEKIAEYRLIGYETRALRREDFNNDRIDAGEIGSGHRVTAIYEITPKGSPAVLNDDLRYAQKPAAAVEPEAAPVTDTAATSDELAFVKIRYKKPDEDRSTLLSMPVKASEAKAKVEDAPQDVRFSLAVAAFGQKLRKEVFVEDYGWDSILDLGRAAKGSDAYGYRAEFLKLVELAKSLSGQ